MNFKRVTFVLNLLVIILLSIFVFNLTIIHAQSTQHGINGFVGNSSDGTIADGATVKFWLYYSNGSLKNTVPLQDTVGTAGLSGISNWYAQDANNFKNPFWQEGDIVLINIVKDAIHNATTNVTLSGTGNNQAPDTQLNGVCGDNFCGSNENCTTCPNDCLLCGDLICNPECLENSTNCVLDCPITCGDGTCNLSMSETYITCPIDCHCGDLICQPTWNETLLSCPIDCGCGNLICEPLLNETALTCPGDCGCGNGLCEINETYFSCPSDCLCGNFVCDLNENFTMCPSDCPEPICGNGLCEQTETLLGCPIDCAGECNNNTICEFGESYLTCPTDCQVTCGNAICDIDETDETCPSDCQPVVCGDRFCDEDQGENYLNCPIDCYKEIARCGDKKCEYAENKNNCCLDCGCDSGKDCIKNKCSEKKCDLFGINFSILGICWYWLFLGLGLIVVAYFIYRKKKKESHFSKK